MIGKIKFYNEPKGFGFISIGDGQKDIFMHATGVQAGTKKSDLQTNTEVSFDLSNDPNNGREKAVNVKIIGW